MISLFIVCIDSLSNRYVPSVLDRTSAHINI